LYNSPESCTKIVRKKGEKVVDSKLWKPWENRHCINCFQKQCLLKDHDSNGTCTICGCRAPSAVEEVYRKRAEEVSVKAEIVIDFMDDPELLPKPEVGPRVNIDPYDFNDLRYSSQKWLAAHLIEAITTLDTRIEALTAQGFSRESD
jgi:hypothetical protein